MESLDIYISSKDYTVYTAPIGLLLLADNQIICKSEYFTESVPDCIIVSSGENYSGGDKPCKSIIIM